MKHLNYYLCESIQELYHFTNAYNLVKILQNDTWITSIEGDSMYISTTRMKFGGTGYPTQLIDSSNVVRVVFDGRKLNSKYKIISTDQMKGKFWAIKKNWQNKEQFEKNKVEIMKQGNVEAEDRVLVDKEYIKNIHQYIKAIHICLDNIDDKYIHTIEDYCEKWGVILKIYKYKRDFNLGR